MTKQYLDLQGLTTYDGEIKTLISTEDAKKIDKIASAIGAKIVVSKADGTIEEATLALSNVADKTYADNVASTAANAVAEDLQELDQSLAAVAKSGNADDISYDNTTSGLTATDVQGAIDEVAAASAGGVDSKTVYATETPGSSSDAYSKRYSIYQGATGSSASPVASEKILDIDLAKDLVVSEGVCRKATAEDVADAGADPGFAVGDYIVVLTIANSGGDKIYIPVQGLVDIYTPEQNASQIQLVIDENNEISATIVAGSVDTAELANGAVTTVKIADDAVTADKVAIAAHTEAQTAGTDGITISVTTTDGQVSGVSASIATNTYDSYGSASTAETNANSYTDDAIAGLDADLDASGTAQHSGVFVVSGVTEVDGVITGVDSTEVEVAGAAASVQSTVIGSNTDASTASTIWGAKAYADASTEAIPTSDIEALFTSGE